jgi:hypothetical protein
MQTVRLDVVVAFSEEEKFYLKNKFSEMCAPAMTGDRKLFDGLCETIPGFCEEIYQIGKKATWPSNLGWTRHQAPFDPVIYSVGASISAHILPLYRNYTAKSEVLHKMVCDIIAKEKYKGGRYSFITEIWPKTKRTDGVDIPKLFTEVNAGTQAVVALLKFRDGRFVKEVRELQTKFTKETWIVWRKKVALYLERYGNQE